MDSVGFTAPLETRSYRSKGRKDCHVVRAAIEIQSRTFEILPNLQGAHLMSQAVNRHLVGK